MSSLVRAFESFIDSFPPEMVEENIDEMLSYLETKYRSFCVRVKSRRTGSVLGFARRPKESMSLLRRAFSSENYKRVVKNGGGDITEVKSFLEALREIDPKALLPTYDNIIQFLKSLPEKRRILAIKGCISNWSKPQTGTDPIRILQSMTLEELKVMVDQLREGLRIIFPDQDQYERYMQEEFPESIEHRSLKLVVGKVEIDLYNAEPGENIVVITPLLVEW